MGDERGGGGKKSAGVICLRIRKKGKRIFGRDSLTAKAKGTNHRGREKRENLHSSLRKKEEGVR